MNYSFEADLQYQIEKNIKVIKADDAKNMASHITKALSTLITDQDELKQMLSFNKDDRLKFEIINNRIGFNKGETSVTFWLLNENETPNLKNRITVFMQNKLTNGFVTFVYYEGKLEKYGSTIPCKDGWLVRTAETSNALREPLADKNLNINDMSVSSINDIDLKAKYYDEEGWKYHNEPGVLPDWEKEHTGFREPSSFINSTSDDFISCEKTNDETYNNNHSR